MSSQQNRAQAPRPAVGQGGLRVGRMTKPHGLKGGLKLELYTDNPELRFVPGAVFHLQVPHDSSWFNKTVTLKELRWFNGRPVGFFKEILTRTVAESIVRAILWIDEAAVAAGQEDDAWYDHDLVGLEVREGSVVLGTVERVEHLPAQDLLVVATKTGTVMVPLVQQIVPEVNLTAGYILVTPPAGLFNDAEAEIVVAAKDTAAGDSAAGQAGENAAAPAAAHDGEA